MKKYSRRDIVVVVPIYKLNLSPLEKISLNTLKKKLGRYTIYLVCPKRLVESIKKHSFLKKFYLFEVENNFLRSRRGYNILLKKPFFYEHFIKYKYILIYQLDCLVFSDNLPYFCNYDFDYWGAPIFKYSLNGSIRGAVIGNGGLSLRKVESFLYISKKYSLMHNKLKLLKLLQLPFHMLEFFLSKKSGVISHLFTKNEDIFWSLDAVRLFPNFKKPSVNEASLFSIEGEKDLCFKLNGGKTPFGCHAFNKYNKDFWLNKLEDSKKTNPI